jgi:hypothetical protein
MAFQVFSFSSEHLESHGAIKAGGVEANEVYVAGPS